MLTTGVPWIKSSNLVGFAAAESLEDALKQLYLIDAIDENGLITSIGRVMAGKRFSETVITYKCVSHHLVEYKNFSNLKLSSPSMA